MVWGYLGATEIVPYTELDRLDRIRAPNSTDSTEIILRIRSIEMGLLQWYIGVGLACAIVHRGGAGLCNRGRCNSA